MPFLDRALSMFLYIFKNDDFGLLNIDFLYYIVYDVCIYITCV
jgi:hypothetical protein